MSKRHKIFFALSALGLTVLLLRMLFLAGSHGETFRKSAASISCKTGQLAAIRGRIFDKNDNLLVWSERCYDLVLLQLPENQKRLKKLTAELKINMQIDLAAVKAPVNSLPLTLKYNLTAEGLAAADMLAEQFHELDVALRWERRCAAQPPELGEVTQIDGMEHGISGWEQKFEHLLKGTPGTFSVMLDRHGKWINSTFRIITPPRNGQDIYMSDEDSGEGL